MYIYYILSCAVQSYGAPGLRGSKVPFGRQVGLQVALVLPKWTAKLHLGANLGCQGALGRNFGLQLSSNLASTCLLECPGPSILLDSTAL